MSVPKKEFGAPHPVHHRSDWWPRAESIAKGLLAWDDVKEMGAFGRLGFFVNTLMFTTVPQHEEVLEIWIRLSESDAAELSKNSRASQHVHPVKGWMRLRVDADDQVDEALKWCKKGYDNAIALTRENRGVPVEKVPESTAHASHRIPQGPRSGAFSLGLEIPGANAQGAAPSNMDVRRLP